MSTRIAAFIALFASSLLFAQASANAWLPTMGRSASPVQLVSGSAGRPVAIESTSFNIPADPRAFLRSHPPLPRLTMPPVAIYRKPVPVPKVDRGPGVRFAGPPIQTLSSNFRGPVNSGEAVVRFMRSHGERRQAAPTSAHQHAAKWGSVGPKIVSPSSINVTGINPWWSYEEGDIPGVGHWMINAYWQNLVVQATDFDVPYRGIDMAFRRTYNSFSGHDYADDDGSTEIGQYGNGWTNTFDAHMSTNSCPNNGYSWGGFYGFSVFDVDGARYDYCFNSTGTLVPPPGMQGTTLVASSDGGSFFWTKRSGTTYIFYSPYYSGSSAAYSGRPYQIKARNQNSYLQFTYSWIGSASSSANLSQISVSTDASLLITTLKFAAFSGQQLLSEVDRPDGVAYTYSYDAAGNLTVVNKPAPNTSGVPVSETYSGYHGLLVVAGPRYVAAPGTDGGYLAFQESALLQAQTTSVQWVGVVNPEPNDGTNTYLQPSMPTGARQYRYETVSPNGANTAFRDTDGHQAVQYVNGGGSFNGTGTPSQREEWTGTQWLGTTEGWDTNNDLTSTTDARGNETDYSYDLNGNEVAAGAPLTGTFRPTTLIDYDASNNVTAFCDPNEVHQAGQDWTGPFPSVDNLCSSRVTVGHAQATFAYPSYEPYGEATTTTTPSGYVRTISYSPTQQGGTLDYGLPTAIVGQSIAQADGTNRVPEMQFWYGPRGRLGCLNSGNGISVFEDDILGRNVVSTDADDSSANSGSVCGKTSGISGWNTQTDSTYFPDGSLSSVQTPIQQGVAGAATTYVYDDDANKVQETLYFAAGTPVTHQNWYDADDRLVEVDNGVATSAGWLTRYLYDLSAGQGVSLPATGTFLAYGNKFVTELYSAGWLQGTGKAFDARDREITSYRWPMNCPSPCSSVASASTVYDGTPATLGLMTSSTNEVGGTATMGYDPIGRDTSVVYSGDGGVTPNETKTYDADGHVLLTTSATLGTMTDSYNNDGRLSKRIEPSGGGITSPATLTYSYYGDDSKKSLSVASSNLTESPLFAYSYRTDGLRQTLVAQAPSTTTTFQWQQTAGGRYTSQALNGVSNSSTQSYNTYGEANAHTIPTNTSFYTASSALYDLQGNLTSVYLGGSGGVTQSLSYDAVNELFGTTPSVQQSTFCPGLYCPTIKRFYSDGTPRSTVTSTTNDGTTSTTTSTNTLDYATGAVLSSADAPSPATNPKCGGPQGTHRGFTYDAAGRESSGVFAWATTVVIPNHSCNYYTGSGSMSQTFDTNNSMVTHNESNWTDESYNGIQVPITWTFAYGPDGHVTLAHSSFPSGGASDTATLHWDGDNLLFTSDPAIPANATYVKIDGALGYVGPVSHLFDFDVAGYARATEGYALNYTAFPTPEVDPNQYYPNAYIEQFAYTALGTITDGVNTFQGVRQTDPITQQWKTPDSYEGRAEDPMSQRSYMWENNNPITYSDPSGYDPLLGQVIPELPPDIPGMTEFLKGTASRDGYGPERIQKLENIGKQVQAGKYPTGKGSSAGEGSGKPFTRGQVKDSQTKTCDACGQQPSPGKPTQPDHADAMKKGGDNSDANRDNLCGWCNRSKGTDSPLDWLRRLFKGFAPPPASPPTMSLLRLRLTLPVVVAIYRSRYFE